MFKRFHFEDFDYDGQAAVPAAAGKATVWGKRLGADTTGLFGLDLVNAKLGDAAREIVAMASARELVTIQFVNAHCVNVALRDSAYRSALASADLLLPDGSGMAIAARMAGVELGENLNGTDLFPEICHHAAAEGRSIFLLGGKPGIAAAAARTMCNREPNLKIAGTRHGFWSRQEEDVLIAEINASNADIVMVGLGVPHQEKWIARVRHRLTARVVMGVGGLFDYYSGAIPRAPLAMRKLGCEWIWRLMQEPRRLFARYVIGNPQFLMSAAGNAWQARDLSGRLSDHAKRGFDVAVAALALLVALPWLVLIGAAIKLEDGGPIFFRQTRIGANGLPFRMWKFRSMVVDAEARLAAIRAQSERDGTCFKMRHDPRITRVGTILRRLSLDEFPQFVNILTGDMSVVGPRPALPREVLTYEPAQRERLSGRPGLTCTWQVSGRAEIPFLRQVELDVEYLRSRSLLKDIGLILRTVPAVVTARGAF